MNGISSVFFKLMGQWMKIHTTVHFFKVIQNKNTAYICKSVQKLDTSIWQIDDGNSHILDQFQMCTIAWLKVWGIQFSNNAWTFFSGAFVGYHVSQGRSDILCIIGIPREKVIGTRTW